MRFFLKVKFKGDCDDTYSMCKCLVAKFSYAERSLGITHEMVGHLSCEYSQISYFISF